MDYLALQDAVLGRRFPAASQRPNAKRWLETAYQDVWVAHDWTFRRVSRASLSVTAGDETPTMPTDFAGVTALFDDSGYELAHLSQDEFEVYALPTTTGGPSVYTVIDRQVYLSPTPGANTTFKLSYRRRLAHKNSGGTVVAGPMSADTDTPLWDDHHSVLIPRAVAIGLQELNDPTWDVSQMEYERQLARMIQDYDYERPQEQWPRSNWHTGY